MNQSTGGPTRRPGYEMWTWTPDRVSAPVLAPTGSPVRIGDAERDDAVASLGDHFAAGRLNREELDERIDRAIQARFDADLKPLFADLPSPIRADLPAPSQGQRYAVRAVWPPLFWLAPILVVATVVGAIALGAPWVLWALVWMMVAGRFWGRRRYGAVAWQRRHHP